MTNGNSSNHNHVPQSTVKATLANQTERRLGDGRRCIKPLCIDTHSPVPAPPPSVPKAPSPPPPSTTTTTVATSVTTTKPTTSTPTVRSMPTIPVDPKPTKGVIRSSTSSITLPSSISSTALFPPLKLQPNLIRKINNEYELRTEKSDRFYILSCVNEKTKAILWKNIFQSPLLAIQATKNFIAIVTLNETQHCPELFILDRQSGLRLYSNIVLTQTLAGLYISENANNIQRATISLIYITGLLTVFDITRNSMTCPVLDINISHLLPPHASIVDIFTLNHINSDTVCLITSSYSFISNRIDGINMFEFRHRTSIRL